MYISIGGAGTAPCWGERPPGMPGAAVHRHILDRMNAINDSLKKKKSQQTVGVCWARQDGSKAGAGPATLRGV